MANSPSGTDTEFEHAPPGEGARIDNVTALTKHQLDRRYTAKNQPSLRGVHPKDHGCVEALFTVSPTLPASLRIGAFSPGVQYRAAIRFSNASAVVLPDSLEPQKDGTMKQAHGSRGMAIKLYDVPGERLLPNDSERSQDFLMINQPVFAFANVEDYEALSTAIKDDDSNAEAFFRRPGLSEAAIKRLQKSGGIIAQVKSLVRPPAVLFPFQEPPLSPLDNRYFSAAPFLFGKGRVMKFSANPVNPMTGPLGDAIINDPNYLRNALRKRMGAADGKEICFDFQIQLRGADSLAGKIATDMEDMCTLWDEAAFPFVTVARITIPPQDIATPERQKFCETLFYTPWHGLRAHRPLGGINRLRQKVYQASAEHRGCPVSPPLPPAKKGK